MPLKDFISQLTLAQSSAHKFQECATKHPKKLLGMLLESS